MRDSHVLIVSTIADIATDDVVRRLASAGVPHFRLNTEEYPFSRTLAFHPTTAGRTWMECDGLKVPIPTAVWYRRFRSPPKPEEMDEGIYTFCLQENRAALLGRIMGLHARWMSHPAAVWQAENKPYQLSLAADLGLTIPKTVVTNDPRVIREAFAQFGEMIAKPARTGHIVCEGKEYAIFTSRVLDQHLDELESARLSPSIYQELIPKKFDLRITIVGRRIYAAAIDSQSDPAAMIDWRRTDNPRLPHHPIVLPNKLSEQLLRLMDSLHLTFAAIDMIQSEDGEYVFLEVNPSAQWMWLDEMLNFGISEAIAKWLGGVEPQ